MLYDIIIIGGGPAGTAAAVYCARKKLKTLMITDSFGGQSVVSDDIQNWIGEKHITGFELAQKFEEHVRSFPEVEIKTERVVSVRSIKCFEVRTANGGVYDGKTVILAAGASRRKLGIPGEEQFNGKGVAYCSTCDAPLFGGKKVAVVGGGNAGLEAVADLFPYAAKIYLLIRSGVLKGDAVTQEEIKKNSKVEIIFNAEIFEILGDSFVSGIKYKNSKTGEEKILP
ncbi:MAG: FAD-dependent oxidoreductase, partial [bacterium]|nr:FAD-dependent oxidoreductase [bacterium]